MCRALEVSRAGYYAFRQRPPSARELGDRELVEQITVVQKKVRGAYGSPRMHRELRELGQSCGRHRIARLQRQHGLGARRKRRYRKLTDSNHAFGYAENLLARQFCVEAPDQAWVSDVTCVWTREGWLYVAVILDLYSRKAVGWALGSENDTTLLLRALRMAVIRRRPGPGLLFHSDRGSTYAAHAFQAVLRRLGFAPSMSRKGDCWDNAVAESFFASMKREWLDEDGYETRGRAMQEVFTYIEMFYNRSRRHSHLGYVSPQAFEAVR
jgi:transposase InsO family protein